MSQFTFIDLFAGIGGLRIPFEELGGECLFTSEWDRFSQTTYKANFQYEFSKHILTGDITRVTEEDIPAHDLLLAGFPCQPFSLAGVSKKNSLGRAHGFMCETQGTLFFDVARIIKFHRPRFFLLENVKNLVSHDRGRTFETIRNVLENELGYHIQYRVLDARGVVPQHRERIFIVGFRDETSFDFDALTLPERAEGPRLKAILHPEDGSEKLSDRDMKNGYLLEDGSVNPKYTLSDKLWNYLQEYARKHREKGNGFGFGLVGQNDVARTLSARYHKDGSEILIEQPGKNPRRLTPRECARLQGYPDSFQIPVSDTQAYRQFGNSVAVPVVRLIARALYPHIVKTNTVLESIRLTA
jgi:DNA (cytosine-5)-methyltransferase 1